MGFWKSSLSTSDSSLSSRTFAVWFKASLTRLMSCSGSSRKYFWASLMARSIMALVRLCESNSRQRLGRLWPSSTMIMDFSRSASILFMKVSRI